MSDHHQDSRDIRRGGGGGGGGHHQNRGGRGGGGGGAGHGGGGGRGGKDGGRRGGAHGAPSRENFGQHVAHGHHGHADQGEQHQRRQQKHFPEQADVGSAPPPAQVPTAPSAVPYVAGSRPEMEEMVRRGEAVVCELKVMKWTQGIAFGSNPMLSRSVAIHGGSSNRMSALPTDVVVVKLAPVSEWESKPKERDTAAADGEAPHKPLGLGKGATGGVLPDGREILHVVKHADRSADTKFMTPAQRISTEIGAPAEVYAAWDELLQPKGVVVAVLERRFQRYQPCRFFQDGNKDGGPAQPGTISIKDSRWYRFKPYAEAYPIVAVYGSDIPYGFHQQITEYLLLVDILSDAAAPGGNVVLVENRFPKGKVLLSLGMAGTVEAETRAIAAMYGVKDAEFTEEVEGCIDQNFEVPTNPEVLKMHHRKDLREEEFVCTIDPATARDLDDALSITKTPSGYRVGIHIADVSYFVPAGSELDFEARHRSTSTYFVERVIPMLPRKLSEDYCSLNQGTDKCAFSCIFQLDHSGKITGRKFHQSVIRNRCRMAYEDAQRIIDGDTSGDSLKFDDSELVHRSREELVKIVVKAVQTLFELGSKLRAMRFGRGALSLNKQKMRFDFEDLNSRLAPRGYSLEMSREANWVVEEFMLLANIEVARHIVTWLPDCALLRRHDPPQRKKMEQFTKAAKLHGYDISAKSSTGLNDSLQKYKEDRNSDALRLMATYCMSLAKYCCSGSDETGFVGHYALATEVYTHFTSPIRRYCDLIAHRQLLLAEEVRRYCEAEGITNEDIKSGKSKIEIDESFGYYDFYLHPSDVESITEHANKRKEAARKCSDTSIKTFFCLYLKALSQRAQVDHNVPKKQRTKAIVSKVADGKFTLYAAEIATDCEVFFNSGNQKWEKEYVPCVNEDDGTFDINWGPSPECPSEDYLEKGWGLFFECVVTLEVVYGATMNLNMVIEPPWNRDNHGILMQVPADL